VPSFGEWGFVLASKRPLPQALHLPEGLKFLTEASARDMFHFPPDMGPLPVEPNRLNNQMLVRYFEEEWAHYVH
jgi:spermidine synthase